MHLARIISNLRMLSEVAALEDRMVCRSHSPLEVAAVPLDSKVWVEPKTQAASTQLLVHLPLPLLISSQIKINQIMAEGFSEIRITLSLPLGRWVITLVEEVSSAVATRPRTLHLEASVAV